MLKVNGISQSRCWILATQKTFRDAWNHIKPLFQPAGVEGNWIAHINFYVYSPCSIHIHWQLKVCYKWISRRNSWQKFNYKAELKEEMSETFGDWAGRGECISLPFSELLAKSLRRRLLQITMCKDPPYKKSLFERPEKPRWQSIFSEHILIWQG